MISNVFSLVRSALHLVFLVLVTTLGATLAILSFPFDRSGNAVLHLARWWSRILLWTAGVRLTVRIEGKLDPRQPYVFMANHLSTVDIWALFIAIPVGIRFIAKKQLGQIPLFGWAMAAGRFIFIDRKNPVAARRSIDLACARIRAGSSVAIFPEGTRSRDGFLAPFKKGGFHLAVTAGVPVVPVAIHGAGDVMAPGRLLVRPGPVVITIGAPIDTAGMGPSDRNALADRVRGEIERATGQKSRPDVSAAS
ncbi:MAG TPA: lysophospholipid acyltransferase family protein [Polyangia bacterium]